MEKNIALVSGESGVKSQDLTSLILPTSTLPLLVNLVRKMQVTEHNMDADLRQDEYCLILDLVRDKIKSLDDVSEQMPYAKIYGKLLGMKMSAPV